MMLVINTAGQVLVNEVLENRSCSYKIVDCPELTQSQQAALVDRLSPMIARAMSENGISDESIISWSLESNDFVTVNEQTNRAALQDPTWSEPSCDYLDAIVWNGVGQQAF